MSREPTFGEMFRTLRNRMELSQTQLAGDFSTVLADQGISELKEIGADTEPGSSKSDINRYENGKRGPKRSRVLFFIYYFRKKGEIEVEEANWLLEAAGHAPLKKKELMILFGSSIGRGSSHQSIEEITIPIKQQPGNNTFIIPAEYITDHQGYIVRKSAQGLVITLITIFILAVGIVAAMLYGLPIMEQLKRLLFPPVATPQTIEYTPVPTNIAVPTMIPAPQTSSPLATSTLTMEPPPLPLSAMWPAPPLPQLQSLMPNDGEIIQPDQTDINFEWEGLSGSAIDNSSFYGDVRYELQLENVDANTNYPVIQKDYEDLLEPRVTLTLGEVFKESKGLYRWRVRAIFAYNDEGKSQAIGYETPPPMEFFGEWSEWNTFTVE